MRWSARSCPKLNITFITFKIYLDVNCSTITYETEPSNSVWSAVEKAKAEMAIGKNVSQEILERCREKTKILMRSELFRCYFNEKRYVNC